MAPLPDAAGSDDLHAAPGGLLLARCRFPAAGTALTCAVSGGADSLALLYLAARAGCRVTAVHVDHGLRPGSGAEADLVAAAAERFGATFRAERAAIAPGPNLEARARDARRALLPAGAATGHTADDQAETILLNLLRGAGLGGLGGMRPGPTKPILDLRRAETRHLCAALGLEPVTDPSNADPAFRRNRVRHELLPLLDALAARDVVPVLVRQASLLRDEADLLDQLAAGIDASDSRALAAAHPALARRAVRRLLARHRPQPHPPAAAAVERVLQVARQEAVACETGGGVRVRRSAGRLHVEGAAGGYDG